MREYMSAYQRLLRMPPVFSINTLVRATGLPRASAKVLLARWVAKKMVESAGPRSGVYFNRVVDRDGAVAHAALALLMKYPSATLCGASVLHNAGWTTQIPSTLHVAVEARASYAKLVGVTLHPCRRSWFQFMQQQGAFAVSGDAAAADAMATYGLRALAPAWALADLYADKSASSWKPDASDLDLPPAALPELRRACLAMRCEPPARILERRPRRTSRKEIA